MDRPRRRHRTAPFRSPIELTGSAGRAGEAAPPGLPDPAATLRMLAMGKNLSTKDRKKLSKKSFALPGKRKYPIPDKAHARNALARVAQNGTPAEQKKVKAAVKKRFPSIGKKKKKS